MDRLTDISKIKELIEKYGFSFSKGLGQNFLINPSVCPKMASAAAEIPVKGAIEIGPGFGVLTRELCETMDRVVAVEIDERLIPVLEETLEGNENLKIINGDILKVDIKKIINDEFSGGPVAVCANLPYYITSPVIMHILESELPISSITAMVQKEAAVRLCAVPGTKECGAVSAAVRYYGEPKIMFNVSAGSFMPAPKVNSAVIKIDIYSKRPYDVSPQEFQKVSRGVFGHRRKTAINSLKDGGISDRESLEKIFEKAEIPPSIRGEKLTMEQMTLIAKELFR